MIEIQIKYETRSLSSKRNLIKRITKSVLAKEKIKNAEISILITTDKKIKFLNKKYRNINKPTDVLSFPQQWGQSLTFDKILLGDVIISAETLKQQVRLYRNTIDDELKLLVTHGIKSLLGYHTKKLDGSASVSRRGTSVFH